MAKSVQLDDIKKALVEISHKRNINSVVFHVNRERNYWIHILRGGPTKEPFPGYYGEAICNTYLSEPWKLTDDQENLLIRLGWEAPEEEEQSFFCYWKGETSAVHITIARQVLETMTQVYGLVPEQMLDIEFENVL